MKGLGGPVPQDTLPAMSPKVEPDYDAADIVVAAPAVGLVCQLASGLLRVLHPHVHPG